MAFVTQNEKGAKTIVKGFVTGGSQAFLTYPTEFVKTQLQLQSKTNPEFNGIVDCIAKTYNRHGFLGLYRGAGVRIVGAGFQQMFRWGAYTNLSALLRDEKTGKLSVTKNIVAGLGAGICEAVCAVTPVETVKTRVTDDQRRGTMKYRGSGDAIVQICRHEGPLGLYRGAVPTIAKQATNQAVRMPLQVQIFQILSFGDVDGTKKSSPVYNGAAGLLAGAASVFLTQPQDCVKSRMQGEKAKELYKSTLDCASQMMQKEGPKVFFAGSLPRVVQVGLTTGISFTIYPLINKFLAKIM